MKNLLSIDTNTKTVKGQKLGYVTAILYLAPHKISGKNLCPFASAGCAKACLYSAGRGKFSNVQQARINKAKLFLDSPREFVFQLANEIEKLYKKYGKQLVIRLNGTSDIPFENIRVFFNPNKEDYGWNIFEQFSYVQFYDYTKNPKRMGLNYPNYHLTFSRSEDLKNIENARKFLVQGKNVAFVASSEIYKSLLTDKNMYFNGRKINIVDGDKNDLRFLDPKESLVILKAKGEAKKDKTGFTVLDLNEL
jgi:hypothetical protein